MMVGGCNHLCTLWEAIAESSMGSVFIFLRFITNLILLRSFGNIIHDIL